MVLYSPKAIDPDCSPDTTDEDCTVIVALWWFRVGVTVVDVTEESTVAVYDSVKGENAGVNARPVPTTRSDKVASALPALVTTTVYVCVGVPVWGVTTTDIVLVVPSPRAMVGEACPDVVK